MRYKSLPLHVRSSSLEPPRRQPQSGDRNPQPTSRLGNLVATSPILLLLVALVVSQVAQASAPAIHFEGDAKPGSSLMVHGIGFPLPDVQLWWDGSDKGMPLAAVTPDGSFAAEVLIPPDTAPGAHNISVTLPGASPGHVRRGKGVLVSASITVQTAHPSAPAEPTPSSTTAPTPNPSHSHEPSATPSSTPEASHSHEATPSPTAVPAEPDPVACTGYPERRVFLEVQSWWKGTNTGGEMAHVHAGTCFPLGQTVAGVVRLDTRITMHHNPGHLFALSTDLFTDGHGTGDNVYTRLDRACTGTCTLWVTSFIDTRGAQDGWHEIRIKPRVRFTDGRRQLTSTGWVLRTENGNPDGSSRSSTGAVIGRGWYEGHGYQNPDLRSMTPILSGAVSGSWTVNVRLVAGGRGFTPTFSAAYVDPDFHMGSDGWRLRAGTGAYLGPLTIDTTRLANGKHRLVLRVDATHEGETLVGLLVVPFTVRN